MTTKRTLLTSAVSLVLCICMLLGTTFAWFTDAVTSSGNIIASGKLDAEMYWSDKLLAADSDEWNNADGTSVFNYNNWEPGYTEVRYVKVSNAGTLNFRWKLSIEAEGNVTDLSDVINVYYVNPVTAELTKEGLKSLTPAGTLTDVLENNTGLDGRQLTPDSSVILAIAFHMDELAGNDYQNKSLCDAGFSLKLLATQDIGESDSFGDDYDGNAFADIFAGFQGGSAAAAVTTNDEGATTSAVSMSGGDVSAEVPAGVKVADGVKSLELVISMMDASGANIQLGATEAMQSLDVHMEGVAEGNTIPMLITLREYLPTGLNSGALKIYHVEDGNTVVMTQVDNPTNHNEFSYDPATGDVTLAMASFSEVAVVADTTNPWDGEKLNYQWYDASATELTIYNADQLAAFATIVDGTAEGIAQDSFESKTVKLNNNIYLDNQLFEPIGWGYVNASHNRKDENGNSITGKVFMGTFDGNGKTIFDLRQSGWDLEEKTETDYTYTNCGFGLFAAASGATFQNLTISGAYVRVECVEAGVLVGLSQNNCTYQNIKILDSKIANYQRPAGGLIGEVSGKGKTTITNVTIGDDVVVGSLWGDFDAPVGGVVGAYWNDTNIDWSVVNEDLQIVMTNVDVGCRLDVYNDITSAYQWHAYRRAGMLIGNTDMSDPSNAHKAYAPFLKCDKVRVYYGDWVDYTYCEFSDFNPRYPWVRTQAGENCEAFSNPRWGVPNDKNGNRVTDMNHVHYDGEECGLVRQFSQLYGGGQGVYGQDIHEGVSYPKNAYSITYVNDGKTLDIVYVTDNSKPYEVGSDQAKKLVLEWAETNIAGGTIAFGGWMNAASIKLTEIHKDNTKNVVLYPYFNSPYTASFVDQNGNILAWCLFNDSDVSRLSAAFEQAKANVPHPGEDFTLINWVIRGTNLKDGTVKVDLANDNTKWDSFKGYKDVTITPHYRYNGADLIEVLDELTGEVDHYQVAGYAGGTGSTKVEIPAYVNGKPVTTINADAFSSYDDLYSVRIPGTVTEINYQSFTADNPDRWGEQRDQITMYYEGDPAVWNAEMTKYEANHNYNGMFKSSWDNMMGDGSRVFFLDENGKVINTMYWELNDDYKWVLHEHAYTYEAAKSCAHGEKSHYEYGGGIFGIGASLQKDEFTNYAADNRPDKEYWIKED